MSTIHPTATPGRIVWYRGADGFIRAAIVAAVNDPFNLNLFVFGQHAQDPECGPKDSVTHADPDIEPGYFPSWHWMPYQKQQAKKAEDREHDAKQMAVAADRAADDRRMRAGVLDMALRTPGLENHNQVLAAASAYQAHIDGEKTTPALVPLAERPALGAAFPGYSEMQPHQQRVVDERAELDDKLTKLNTFIDGAMFGTLDADERDRLKQQAATMAMYSDILSERIAAF